MQPEEPTGRQGREEIVATKGKFHSVFSVLEIPVEESTLPVRSKTYCTADFAKFNPSEQTAPDSDQLYSMDARNPLLKLRFEIDKSDGVESHNSKKNICVSFPKLGLLEFFERLEEIQDKLDLYL